MEVVPKDSNFIEGKKTAPQISLHKRHTPTPSRSSTSPLHSLRSKAYRVDQYRFTPPLLTEHILPYALPPRNHSKDEALTMGEAPACSVGKSDQREHADF